MISKQPNIFQFATSELSQDAVIAWLIQWADSKYKSVDEKLYALGNLLLKSLLEKNGIQLAKFENLEIIQQHHKIDVFVKFTMNNKSVAIIIEDKTTSNAHSNQLERYLEQIKKENYDIIVPIFFKTGFQEDFSEEIKQGYAPYTIKDFLMVIEKGIQNNIKDDIFLSYYSYLKDLEISYDQANYSFINYKDTSISKWDWWSCTGFFVDHKKHFNAGWSSVSNNREALLAFWFGGRNLNVLDNEGNSITLIPYIDIIYSENWIKVNYRLDLNNIPQKDNGIRNRVYDAFKPYLEKNGVKHKKPIFRKAKRTLLLAQITDIDMNMKYDELVKLLSKLDSILKDFTKNY